jgi:hypothetical protein
MQYHFESLSHLWLRMAVSELRIAIWLVYMNVLKSTSRLGCHYQTLVKYLLVWVIESIIVRVHCVSFVHLWFWLEIVVGLFVLGIKIEVFVKILFLVCSWNVIVFCWYIIIDVDIVGVIAYWYLLFLKWLILLKLLIYHF